MIFTAQNSFYVAPFTGEKVPPPRQGRWELGDGGKGITPAPTVNLQPLPAAFQLSGWTAHNARLNGEYLPLSDGSKLLNERPIFKHAPVVGTSTNRKRWRMYWTHGAWRIGHKDHMQPDQTQCVAYCESDATHPTAIADVAWNGTSSGREVGNDDSDFELVAGVTVAPGTVRPCANMMLC
ncbi:MAG: hypothetical protein GY813_16605 [Halieaceae bacterium]|nr:hypothetical protein [Halieaceae bacterium]